MRIRIVPAILLLAGAGLVLSSYRYESRLTGLPLIGPILQQRQEARQEAKIHKLNIYMLRDYGSLFDSADGKDNVPLDNYIQYFRLVSEYLPERAEGYALLGFCYARQQDIGQALENYKKAFMLDPQFFWTYYNLGLLLWHNGQAPEAEILFQKALSLDPKQTLTTIASSKVYMDILGGRKPRYDIVQSLREGYRRAAICMGLIGQKVPTPKDPPLQFF